MPWGDGPNGGFSTARPWLRMAPDGATRSVAIQDDDPGSVLNSYRRLVWLRRRHPALQVGRYRRLAGGSPNVFAFERAFGDEVIVVVVNLAGTPAHFRVRTARRWSVVLDTHERPTLEVSGSERLLLGPNEAIVLVAG